MTPSRQNVLAAWWFLSSVRLPGFSKISSQLSDLTQDPDEEGDQPEVDEVEDSELAE